MLFVASLQDAGSWLVLVFVVTLRFTPGYSRVVPSATRLCDAGFRNSREVVPRFRLACCAGFFGSVRSEGSWFPALAPEKRRKDGARKICGVRALKSGSFGSGLG